MKLSSIIPALAAVATLAITGCPRPENNPPQQGWQQAGGETPFNTVQIGDPWIASNVVVANSGGKRGPTGNLEVFAIIQNNAGRPVSFEARARFFEENGMPLDEDTSFERVSIAPRGTGTFRTRSMTTAARHYVIEVRAAQ